MNCELCNLKPGVILIAEIGLICSDCKADLESGEQKDTIEDYVKDCPDRCANKDIYCHKCSERSEFYKGVLL